MNAKNIIEFINDYQNGNETALDLLKKQAMAELEASTLFKIGVDYPAYIDVNLLKSCISIMDENDNGITLVTSTRNLGSMYLQGKESEGMICQIRYDDEYPSPVYNLD